MTRKPENYELADGWQPTIAELVEHNTLCAVYQLENSEKMVRIVPIPTDRVADYTHSHRVILETPEGGEKVVAEGREVDDVLDAKLAAVEVMKRIQSS
jgi:hypothetical protein